ncbi:hypothetical protein [Phycisphaera mikurensis]|uniref:Uncharacterized protein n=1 Tax=Phycisphaera mikurensis (strain NBRC 102666 / KCTC 22515 / FYK2301M01) TaxID=1142394 RepID=I0ID26_PHYMF|nr:hypothetical protein [Phycisphaera mikurensis]MBB6442289.1 hypothetical protein [Phycisphaera mikurensis]BAM03164.1 hypothetical protein PSMK_10050 [Phycisphaera mikurensis NBRC 102666]
MSGPLLIDLAGRDRFAPGEEVAVAIGWELAKPPDEFVLELVWRTAGRGRTDTAAARRRVWRGGLPAAGAEVVAWRMPAGPHTRDGKLVSIAWDFRLRTSTGAAVAAPVEILPAGGGG